MQALFISKTNLQRYIQFIQSAVTFFKRQNNHEDKAILLAQDFIETNYTDKISIGMLAVKFAIGNRSFERCFKKGSSNTVVKYVQRVKLKQPNAVSKAAAKI